MEMRKITILTKINSNEPNNEPSYLRPWYNLLALNFNTSSCLNTINSQDANYIAIYKFALAQTMELEFNCKLWHRQTLDPVSRAAEL
jgi:hypothetical protein